MLSDFKEQVRSLRNKENSMKFGFNLFGMNPPPNADLDFMEKEIENLEKAWGLKDEWDSEWLNEISKIKFSEFDKDALDDKVEEYNLKINAFSREMKKWDIVGYLRIELEKFRNTLPLIASLRQDYMRPRHWDKLKIILNKRDLDPMSPTFDLGELFSLGLLAQSDNVLSITEVARAEYQIEKTLKTIKDSWAVTEMVIEDVKKAHATLSIMNKRSIDLVNDQISNHKMLLSQLKTNAFFASFADEIIEWEKDLIKSGETLELLVQVQKLWLYLEAILASQPSETYKQLSGDITKFKFLNERFMTHIDRIKRVKNALACLKVDGF
jgi:dynein heavy chain